MGKGRKPTTTPEFEATVIAEFNAGMASANIATRHMVSKVLVRSILKRHQLKPSRNASNADRRHKYDAATVDAVVQCYLEPNWINVVATRFGIPYGTVRKMLARRGVLRDDGKLKPFSSAQLEAMRVLRQSGTSFEKIGTDFGVHGSYVRRLLIQMGEPTATQRLSRRKPDGVMLKDGYRFVHIYPEDPFYIMSDGSGYVAEHRLKMAKHLGRALMPWETVHHKNTDRSDNKLKNLQLRIGKHGTGGAFQCADCGSHNIIAVPLKGNTP